MAARKLSPSERIIIRELIFPESFSHLIDETGYTFGMIRDDLINLINHGYIEVYSADGLQALSPFYDSDNIDQYSFQATKSGLKTMQNHAV